MSENGRTTPKVTRKLEVIPKPQAGTPGLIREGEGTVVVEGTGDAEGPFTFLCGTCDAVLLLNVEENSVQGIFLTCNGCGSYNQSPW